jgi:deoxycytidylate deaminase
MSVDNTTAVNSIEYPYMPTDGQIKYVEGNNQFMRAAKEHARKHSMDAVMPNASVLVKGGKIIGRGANGSTYHDTHECERIKRGIPTGQGYELCEGCHPKNHSEPKAIADALAKGSDPKGAEIYLWGHWWCCEPCWKAMFDSGVRVVHLLQKSQHLFNKDHPENIVGRQFAD